MNHLKIFGFKVNNLIFYFISCSFIGWCIETSYMYFIRGRFVFSGLLHCPFSPIYGFAGILMIIALTPIKHNALLFFFGAVIITTLLEYFTGYLIKMTLHRMLWNYKNEFLNINGFICLKSSIIWGLLSVTFIYLLKPLIRSLIYHVPKNLRTVIVYSVFIFFIFKAFSMLKPIGIVKI
jgi:uncharacterized membrane protein